MGRINLMIADKDEEYTARLADYLLQNCGHVFNITVCSSQEKLKNTLICCGLTPDVLLIDEALAVSSLSGNAENIIMPASMLILSEDLKPAAPGTVCKYRHVSKISRDILNTYYEHGGSRSYPSSGERHTKLIGISSTSGGTGKSTFSACLAVQCAIKGFTVLFLSLEEIPSTSHFFEEEHKKNLSYVFYKIKSGEQDVAAAIESCAAMSGQEGLYYMPAPENPLEYDEISGEELGRLLQNVRNLGKYDYVFIDMQSGYSMKTEISRKECDLVFVLIGDGALSAVKNKETSKALNRIKNEEEPDLTDKIVPVYCNGRGGSSGFEHKEFNGKNIYDRLPYDPDFLCSAGINQFYNPSNQYVQAAAEILCKHVISPGNPAVKDELL